MADMDLYAGPRLWMRVEVILMNPHEEDELFWNAQPGLYSL